MSINFTKVYVDPLMLLYTIKIDYIPQSSYRKSNIEPYIHFKQDLLIHFNGLAPLLQAI